MLNLWMMMLKIYYYHMGVMWMGVMLALVVAGLAWPATDVITKLPNYPGTFTNRVFGGYLDTSSAKRSLYYLYLENAGGAANKLPVVLWLNGGPGCSSMLGFLQEIGAYVLEEDQIYEVGKELTPNPFSWLREANLLFIESPAGVGYSINNQNTKYEYNDYNTAKDSLDALVCFFTRKFEQLANRTFYIAGESYAGKYIPDLANNIIGYNAQNPTDPINLKGLLIFNGAFTFDGLQSNRVQFMISHNMIDPRLIPYWQRSCKSDPESAGCSYFYQRYEDMLYRIDKYNIYGQCYGRKGSRQLALMDEISVRESHFYRWSRMYGQGQLKAGEWCSYDEGVEEYMNNKENKDVFKTLKPNEVFSICNMTIFQKYKVDPKGSYASIPKLLEKGLKIYIASGDWDDIVPFTDTLKNIKRMNLNQLGSTSPWSINNQHAGFIRTYSKGLKFYIVKGAGHQVPLYQRERSFKVFQDFLVG